MTDKQALVEVMVVRDMYKTTTTAKQWHNMIIGLGHILLSEKLSETTRGILEATLFETGWRASVAASLDMKSGPQKKERAEEE